MLCLLKAGNYSQLVVNFELEREVGHYIMDYYVPSIMLVVVSWVSFWLDPNAVPGRTTLGKYYYEISEVILLNNLCDLFLKWHIFFLNF